MDTNEEERAKGKTVEVGRAHFTTVMKRYTLLDCPGHKSFVPNMIGGASQADIGVLVISARKDEFETGFDRGGQTREHAMLAKTLGIRRLIVMVNKMDDPSVLWAKERFDEIESKLSPFLKQWGYNLQKEVTYIPVSGQYGINLMTPVDPKVCPWYAGKPSFMQFMDSMDPLERDPEAPLRIPVITRYKDMGVLYVLGKVESGTVVAGTELLLMPNNKRVCTPYHLCIRVTDISSVAVVALK
jgi:peptide chain release factor subunit 3